MWDTNSDLHDVNSELRYKLVNLWIYISQLQVNILQFWLFFYQFWVYFFPIGTFLRIAREKAWIEIKSHHYIFIFYPVAKQAPTSTSFPLNSVVYLWVWGESEIMLRVPGQRSCWDVFLWVFGWIDGCLTSWWPAVSVWPFSHR